MTLLTKEETVVAIESLINQGLGGQKITRSQLRDILSPSAYADYQMSLQRHRLQTLSAKGSNRPAAIEEFLQKRRKIILKLGRLKRMRGRTLDAWNSAQGEATRLIEQMQDRWQETPELRDWFVARNQGETTPIEELFHSDSLIDAMAGVATPWRVLTVREYEKLFAFQFFPDTPEYDALVSYRETLLPTVTEGEKSAPMEEILDLVDSMKLSQPRAGLFSSGGHTSRQTLIDQLVVSYVDSVMD